MTDSSEVTPGESRDIETNAFGERLSYYQLRDRDERTAIREAGEERDAIFEAAMSGEEGEVEGARWADDSGESVDEVIDPPLGLATNPALSAGAEAGKELSYNELKTLLAELDLDTSGKKADLQARLEGYSAEEE